MRRRQLNHFKCFIFTFLLLLMNIQVFAVTAVHVTKVTLNKTTDTLMVGKTDTLKATIASTNTTNKAIKWTSSNSTIAKVDGTGKVTSLKAGTATITATSVDGNKEAACIVSEMPIKKYTVGIDDVLFCFKDITLNKPASIWDNPFLGFLKSCHDTYGTNFSCFCFYQGVVGYPREDTSDFNLSMMPTRYVEEFQAASSWLKWGFHAKSNNSAYNLTSQDPYADAILVDNQLSRIVGKESLTGLIRIHRYMGNVRTITKLKDIGIWGLYGVDPIIRDSYLSYHLNKLQSNALYDSGLYLDPISGLSIINGDGVVERMTPRIGGEAGYLGSFADMSDYLANYLQSRPRQQYIHISSHETWLQFKDYQNSLIAGLKWLKDNGWGSEHLEKQDVLSSDRIVGNGYYVEPVLTSTNNDNPKLTFAGGKNLTNYRAVYANDLDRGGSRSLLLTSGITATYKFTGNHFKFVAQKTPLRGIIGLKIDGEAEFLIDQYDSNTIYRVLQYETWLAQGSHTLVFRCINRKNVHSAGKAVTIDSIDTISSTEIEKF